MNRTFLTSIFLLVLPVLAVSADDDAPTAWELSPYRVHLLTAVESSASLSPRLEQDIPTYLAARASSAVGGTWRLEASEAPLELRYRLLHSLGNLTAEDIPAAAKKGDKVILLGIAKGEPGFIVRARELDLTTGLWNTTATRIVRQSSSVKQEALWCLLSAFAPQARIEKVEDKIVTLKLRASALARTEGDLPLFLAGTVFRPVLVKCDTHGTIQAGPAEAIPWTYLIPTENKTSTSPFTARIETGLSDAVLPGYHPTRLRLALGVRPSQDATTIKLVATGSAAPLEGYEIAAVEPEVAGQPGLVESLGRSGPDGIVSVPTGKTTVRTLLVRHGEEVLARLPMVPGLTEEITVTLADDRPRLAIESILNGIQDNLLDLVARREVLVSRIKAATKEGDTAAAAKLKDQLRLLPSVGLILADLGKQQRPIEALPVSSRHKMQKRIVEIRKLAEKLKAENPADKL